MSSDALSHRDEIPKDHLTGVVNLLTFVFTDNRSLITVGAKRRSRLKRSGSGDHCFYRRLISALWVRDTILPSK